jgi:hypothetical protein
MAGKKIAAGVLGGLLSVMGAVPLAAQGIEFRLSFGGWTLSPLHTTVETESEKIIQNEFFKLLDSILPEWSLSPVWSDVSISSTGTFCSGEFWLPFRRSRFAVGLRGDWFSFHLPFTASAREILNILGFPIAELTARGWGNVDLKGLGLALMGRWTAYSSRRLDLSLQAGISALPFRGRIAMDQELSVVSLLGNLQLTGRLDQSIAELREVEDQIPSLIIAPSAGLDFKYRLTGNAGLFINLTVSQGTFVAGGFFIAL